MYERLETIHPMIVHFPIVLVIGSLAAFAAYAATRRDFFAQAGAWTVTLGAVSAAAAVIAGKVAEAHASHSAEAHEILKRLHEPLGYVLLALTAGLAIWGFASHWKFRGINLAAYLAVLVLTTGVIAATGHFGATMVYQHGMGVNPAILKPVEHNHASHDSHGPENMPMKEQEDPAHEHPESAPHQDNEAGDHGAAAPDDRTNGAASDHAEDDDPHNDDPHAH